MAKYRRGRKRLLTSGANLADVPLWEIWIFLRTAVWWLGSALLRVWLLNPLSVLIRRQRRLYQFQDKANNYCITPPWTERIGDFFRSDESRKSRLLHWVQDMLPRLGVEDFKASWHDGVALCALLEEISPGLCPRPELLKSHHRVNNCRLGIKLAQRYLGVPKMMITAEEMAIADTDVETKIIHLIQLLKWKHQKGGSPSLPTPTSLRTRATSNTDPVPVKVVARGTGLKAGIVGRRAKFNILTDSAPFLDLHIEIQGPNNEVNSERITSLNQGLDRVRRERERQTRLQTAPQNSQGSQLSGYPVTSEEEGKSKVIEDEVGNVFLRQKSFDDEMNQNIIPFDYQCVGEGRFLVTYIPRSSGTYFISIKSYDVDIEGSPFEVKVSDWMTSWNVMPKPRVMSFDMLPSIEELPAREKMSSTSPRPDKSSGAAARPSSSRNSMAQVSRQLTIMKKRVLKRVITRNGEEILLTPSPTLSRQSSADVSDMSEDERTAGKAESGKQPEKPCPNPHKSPAPPRDQGEEGPERKHAPHKDRDGEDFSTNTCNITLSVTSFENEVEEEERKKAKEESVSSNSLCLPERSKSPALFMEGSGTTYDMTPGMYPSTPKRLARIPESPIHINVRSQLLGPVSSVDSGLYIIKNEQGKTEEIGLTGLSSSHLQISPRCLSPSTSDEASGNCSDFTEFDASPRQKDFLPDFSQQGVSPSAKSALREQTPHGGEPVNLEEEEKKNSANRRRFEETLTQRDRDADDSTDACSQLVSALTELNPTPTPTKKSVGRSYSDGAKVGGVRGMSGRERHYNIRMKRKEGRGEDVQWASSSPGCDVDTKGKSPFQSSSSSSSSSSWNTLRTKLFQPDGVRKTCVYINNTSTLALPRGSSDLSSRRSSHTSSSSESQSPGGEQRTGEDRRQEERRSQMKDTVRKWRTFDGGSTVQHEGEWGKNARWKFSLQGKRSHSFTAGWQHNGVGADLWKSPFPYNDSSHLENMSIMDKLNDEDEILEVVIESDEPQTQRTDEEDQVVREEELRAQFGEQFQSAFNSDTLSASSSTKNKFRGNLFRQEHVGSNKSSSENSTDTEKSRSISDETDRCRRRAEDLQQATAADGGPSNSHNLRDRSAKPRATSGGSTQPQVTSGDNGVSSKSRDVVGRDKDEARRFRTIQKQKKRSRHTTPVSILTPKAKIDKCTQVAYSEIKAETGWIPPRVRLHRRKKYQKINSRTLSRDSSLSGNADNLRTSPVHKHCRLSSSKSSSFSDSSLVFAADGAEIPENPPELETRTAHQNIPARTGKGQTSDSNFHSATVLFEARLKEDESEEEGEGREGRREGNVTAESSGGADAIARSKLCSAGRTTHNSTKTSDYSSESTEDSNKRHTTSTSTTTTTSAQFPPPYSRARSDPQFSRRLKTHCVEHAPAVPCRKGIPTARPPRPHDRHVLDWVQSARDRGEEHEQPERQWTVDTLDSGIENESPVYSRFVSGHRRIHRRPYPWSIDLDPGLVRANAAAVAAVAASSGLDPFSGHRRLTRHPYPWEMDLDPCLIQSSNVDPVPSGGTSSHQHQHLSLTLGGVIEAAVHHTVRQLLSGSSVTSSGSYRNFANISFDEELDPRKEGRGRGGSWSDTELYCTEFSQDKRRKRRKTRSQRRKKPTPSLTRASSTVKEDFVRSVAILSSMESGGGGAGVSGGSAAPGGGSLCRRGSPDVTETKSDGRYSPYSATDIPCFELPSDTSKARHNLLGSPGNFPHFPHQRSCSSKHSQRKVPQQKSQDSTSNDETKSDTMGDCLLALPSSASPTTTPTPQQQSLALRRQVGLRSSSSSPEMTCLTVDPAGSGSTRHKKFSSKTREKVKAEKENESDTNTSEDSYRMDKEILRESKLSANAKLDPKTALDIFAANPRIVIHSSGQNRETASSNTSTDDSYRGFGISRTQRYDLIDHLKGFRDLTERQKSNSPDGSRRDLSPTPSSVDDMYLTETSSCYLSQYSDPLDDNSPSSVFAQKSFFQEGDLEAFQASGSASRDTLHPNDQSVSEAGRERLGSGSSGGRDLALSPLQARVAHACMNDAHVSGGTGSDVGFEDKCGRCVAYGAGLSFGQVGEANNFQVWAERPGKGCVTVAVFGPRSHCVTETSVTYIGDNLYDVTYSVTSPGYYVIVVKWGEQSLPDSPYICKVTY